MKQINTITDSPRQAFQIPIDDGSTLYITLYFYQTQNSWYFDFIYDDYVCKGNRVVLSPNTLKHLINILPFGIAFLCENEVEPYAIDDFSTGRVTMNILNSEEVQQIEDLIYNVG